jgi:hypothetical protein
MYKFQVQKFFILEGMLENNINYILKFYLNIQAIKFR